MGRIVWVRSYDWEALYVDGNLTWEGHNLDLFRYLSISNCLENLGTTLIAQPSEKAEARLDVGYPKHLDQLELKVEAL